jgi:hypothetical protein
MDADLDLDDVDFWKMALARRAALPVMLPGLGPLLGIL